MIESGVYLSSNTKHDLLDRETSPRIHADGLRAWQAFVNRRPLVELLRPQSEDEDLAFEHNAITYMTLSADLKTPAMVRIQKIYYPHWNITDNHTSESVMIRPDPETGLVIFDLPAGKHHLMIGRQLLWQEKIGFLGSVIGIGWCVFLWYVSRRENT
jgi:hypothetical protein